MATQLTFDEVSQWEMPKHKGNVVEIPTLDRAIWTETKAQLIEIYLRLFLYITKHGTYIDGFAGPQDPTNPSSWAARLAVALRPYFMKSFFLCEQDPAQFRKLNAMLNLPEIVQSIGKRRLFTHEGDFNQWVPTILSSGEITDSRATFALLDQRTFECQWSTVEALANHKKGAHKIELFYFFPTGWLARSIAATKNLSVLDAWWGDRTWEELRKKPTSHHVDRIMRKIQSLGYADVKAWPITEKDNGEGATMYHMVHATDHLEAPKLMNRAYRSLVATPIEMDQLKLEFDFPDEDTVSASAP